MLSPKRGKISGHKNLYGKSGGSEDEKVLESPFGRGSGDNETSPGWENSPINIFNSENVRNSDLSPRYEGTMMVFERLVADSNRRNVRDLKLKEFKEYCEIKSARSYMENEEVYGRLLVDTEKRRENTELREIFRQQCLEKEAKKFSSSKKISKTQTNLLLSRLLSNFYSDSPKKSIEKLYQNLKQHDFTNIHSIDSLQIEKTDFLNSQSPKSPKSPQSPQSLQNPQSFQSPKSPKSLQSPKGSKNSQTCIIKTHNPSSKTTLSERLVIEKFYGRPGTIPSSNKCHYKPNSSIKSPPSISNASNSNK
jgi:hypothetical protein